MATVLALATRDASREPMKLHDAVSVSTGAGIDGDYRGTRGGRQVTVLAREAWEQACRDADAELPWTARRANVLVEGLDLVDTKGARLRLGEVVLEVTQETAPCARMEEARPGLRKAMVADWRGGVCCRVVEGGTLRVGDEAAVVSSV